MELGAQLTLYPDGSSSGFDSPRSLSVDYKSSQRSAAFFLPPDAKAQLALTNAASSAVNGRLVCGRTVEDFAIIPNATFLKSLSHDMGIISSLGALTGIACDITYSGPADAIRAFGVVSVDNYAAPIRFYDSSTATSTNLTAVALQTSSRTAVIVHNTTGSPVLVVPVIRDSSQSPAQEERLQERLLLPYQTAIVEVEPALGQLSRQGIKLANLTVETAASAGAIVGALTQTDSSNIVEDIPLRTSNPPRFDRGSYPLRWSEDYTNQVTIANTSTKPLGYRAIITAGSAIYVLPKVTLSPNTTMVYDVDALRRQGTPDVNGQRLPSDAPYGKFLWSELSDGKNSGLLGRTSLASTLNRRRSSFSCGEDCDQSDDVSAVYIDGVPYILAYGTTASVPLLEQYSSTNQPTYTSPYPYWLFVPSDSPNVSASGVVEIDPDPSNENAFLETATGVGAVYVGWTVSDYYSTYSVESAPDCGTVLNQYFDSTSTTVPPVIKFTGQTAVLNNTTQSAVVGQQIALTASYTLPSGVTVQSQSWSVPGTTIGGYTASINSGATTATDFTQQSTTFYWVDAGLSRTVTFTLNLSDGSQPSASVTFNVTGPVGGTITVGGPFTPAVFNYTSPPKVQVGNGTTVAGITFTASASSGDSGGQYSFVQIINSDAITRTDLMGTCHETTGTGLDTVYPYSTGTTTNDSPNTGFYATDEEITRTDSFTMYLLWQPSVSASIPVPIGYVNWQWSADVVQTSTSPPLWSMSTSTPPTSSQSGFTPSLIYPQWTSHGTGGVHDCIY